MVLFWLSALTSIFAVMNPIANVPIFLALAGSLPQQEQRALARKSTIIAFVVVLFFSVLGNVVFDVMGITLDAFRVAGGILLFSIAISLVQGKSSHVHHPNPNEHEEIMSKDDIAVVPLATPILAGPGTIATVMALDSAYHSFIISTVLAMSAFTIVLLITYILFFNAAWVQRHLPQTTINLITRMMGLLLTVVAVQMASSGLINLFPGLR